MPYSHLENAVIGGNYSPEEEAMMDKPVTVRDGDDLIEIVSEDESEEVSLEESDELETDESDEEEETEGESDEEESEELEDEDSDSEEEEDDEIPDVSPKSLEEAGKQLNAAREGQDALVQQAIKNGLDESLLPTFMQEYEENGDFSEASYKALEEVGYSRQFVQSYMRGQEAIADAFANSMIEYAGGSDGFAKIQAYMEQNESIKDAFYSAVDRDDSSTVKALIDAAKMNLRSKFGSKPKRDLTTSAKPARKPTGAPRAEPFGNRSEMVKAMSDSRYSTDAAYRSEVEKRVMASTF